MGALCQWLLLLSFCFLVSCFSHKDEHHLDFEGYVELTDQARVDNDVLIKEILRRKCKISVDFRGSGSMTITPAVDRNEARVPGRLCSVHQKADQNWVAKKPALLAFVDTFSDLNYGTEGWYYFLNKAYFAVQDNRDFYLWVGRLPKESRETFKSDRDTIQIPWYRCAELRNPMDGVSMYKILAILALFESPNPPHNVVVLDSDMFLPFQSEFQPFHDLDSNFEDPSVFLIGDSAGEGGKMTSGMLGVKNNIDAKRFLAMWWQLQCGLKEEHSLYMTMVFYYFSLGYVKFSVKTMGLSNFERSGEGSNAYFYLKSNLADIQNSTHCRNSRRTITATTPPLDHPFFPLHHQLLVEDPLCGIVASISQQNGICRCHINECEGSCAGGRHWPPPSQGASFRGTELQYEQMWELHDPEEAQFGKRGGAVGRREKALSQL